MSAEGSGIPAKWWLNTDARPIHSMDEFTSLLSGELKNKHIIIDFYMQNCKYCYYMQDDFNRIHDDMETWFG